MAVPHRFSRQEAELVFRRAAELDGELDPDGTLEIEALEQIGVDAGLSRESVRRAAAEVRDRTARPLTVDEQWDVIVARVMPPPRTEQWLMVDQAARQSLLDPVRARDHPTRSAAWERRRGAGALFARRLGPRGLRPLLPVELLEVAVSKPPPTSALATVVVRARLVRPAFRVLSIRRQAMLATGIIGGLTATTMVFDSLGTPDVWFAGGASLLVNTWLGERAARNYVATFRLVEAALERLVDRLDRRQPIGPS